MENFQVNNMQAFPFKGFWIRVVASLLDAIILSIVFIFLAGFILFFFGSLFGEAAGIGMLFLFILGGSILMLLYKPLMEASDYQATFGKYFLNMKKFSLGVCIAKKLSIAFKVKQIVITLDCASLQMSCIDCVL